MKKWKIRLCVRGVVFERFHFEIFQNASDFLAVFKENQHKHCPTKKIHAMEIFIIDIIFILAVVKILGNDTDLYNTWGIRPPLHGARQNFIQINFCTYTNICPHWLPVYTILDCTDQVFRSLFGNL